MPPGSLHSAVVQIDLDRTVTVNDENLLLRSGWNYLIDILGELGRGFYGRPGRLRGHCLGPVSGR
jgi:hypothetical protein